METPDDLIKRFNEIINDRNKPFDIKPIKELLNVIRNKFKLSVTFANYSAYFKFKEDEAVLNRRKCILFGQFEDAASWRDVEWKYHGKYLLLNEPKLTVKSKFFIEDRHVVFCYHRDADSFEKVIIDLMEPV